MRARPTTIDEEVFERARPTRRTLRRLLATLRPYARTYGLGIVAGWVVVGAALLLPHLIRVAIERYILAGRPAAALFVGAAFLGVMAVRTLAGMVRVSLLFNSGQRALNDLREAIFEHIQRLSLSYFDRTKQGRVIARVDRDVEALQAMVTWTPTIAIDSIILLAGAVAILFAYDVRLCAALGLSLPPLALATWRFRRRGIEAHRAIRTSNARLTANLAENITGVRVVQAYAREWRNYQRFRRINLMHNLNVRRSAFLWNAYFPVVSVIFGVARVALLIYGGWLLATGRLGATPAAGIGILLASNFYIGLFFGPLHQLSLQYNDVLSASAAAERIFALLDTEPEVRDRPGACAMPPVVGRIRFENVWFAYSTKPEPEWVLRELTIEAEPGEVVALVGPTGAGKSSVINLLARFYEPQRGRVTIDGIDIADVTLQSLHRQMGIVLQDNVLFSGTVMRNLKFGRPDATDAEVIAAAEALGSHEFIEALPQGYQTDVQEGGAGLSQGQRQLICFTRALIAQPRILILDEATSAVDAATEADLQRALDRLTAGRTTFIVAHRLSTIRDASRIYVIEDGRAVEQGRHEEMIACGGRYATMYEEFLRV